MNEIYEFLKKSGVFYLATSYNGKPFVRPFGAVSLYDGKLYIMTGNKKEVFKQIESNPFIEISAMTPDGKWLRLKSKVVKDERRSAKKSMLDENPTLRSMYSEDDGIMEVFYLKDARATVCSFTEPAVSYSF